MKEVSFHRPRPMTVYRERSASVKSLMEALAKAMSEFTPIVRDSEGEVIRNGRKTKYRYATLDSINRSTRMALLKHGVVPLQEYCVSDEGTTLVTSLNYGEEFISSVLPIRQFDEQQRQKAHMSYMRRTAIEGLLCLFAEDDADGAEEKAPEAADNKTWQTNDRLCREAIANATTPAEINEIRRKVSMKVESMEMNPDSWPTIEHLCAERLKAIATAKGPVPVRVTKGKEQAKPEQKEVVA